MSLRQVLRDVVTTGRVRIIPEHAMRTYHHWVDNLNDWCLSRQVWWGHRVPVWYRGAEEMYVGHRGPEGDGWEQDPDTLDTWFSSGLWTWSTLVDPDVARDPSLSLAEILRRSPDFLRFHPTTVLETGYDILFFWVARMILLTTYVTGDVPFSTVYLHGLVLDAKGEKMTKSRPETRIDPLDVVRDVGADSLRLALVLGSAPGSDMRLGRDKVEGCRRFVNKLWHASALVLRMSRDGAAASHSPTPFPRVAHPVNRAMLDALVTPTDAGLEAYAFGEAVEGVRTSFRAEFCDFYVEAAKTDEVALLPETHAVARHALEVYLRLLHPFAPFITEEIWSRLGHGDLLARAAWPVARGYRDLWPGVADAVGAFQRAAQAARGLRTARGVRPGAHVDMTLRTAIDPGVAETMTPVLARLARARLTLLAEAMPGAGAQAGVDAGTSTAVDHAFVLTLSGVAERGPADGARRPAYVPPDAVHALDGARERLRRITDRLADEAFRTRASAVVAELEQIVR